MEYNNLIYRQEKNVGILIINRPKALNALNEELLKELNLAINKIIKDETVYVLIITGEGKAFVAGADIAEMNVMSPESARKFAELGSSIFRKIELMDKPVIAAVNGFALGGGCELAMSCDLRIASEKARFGQPEVALGITPGFSGTQRLSRLIGIGKAKELIFTAAMIKAEEAKNIGLINKVVPHENLLEEALKIANNICINGQIAVRYSKSAINRGIETDIETAITIERDLFSLCFANEDQSEGMKAFLEKRNANFKNTF
ncbi:short-chain-enoyl-CoA hydratase [Clostridium grantii]|uniref:short-chain-enoyl-CoA hydratase n=1 Tax=Clostridium grantii DSM 8605 TaxID=1121316 RepID=A0A1M5S8R9_9CLOT|nr:short-chain-enoyl-CoA hydratase [Clostridium grantii]SHH35017.1 enoyl-CoA hydratase [Clostridium grantii DSM 8605]